MLPGLQNTAFMSVLESTAVSCSDLNAFLVKTLSLCNARLNPLLTGTQRFAPSVLQTQCESLHYQRTDFFNVSCKFIENW